MIAQFILLSFVLKVNSHTSQHYQASNMLLYFTSSVVTGPCISSPVWGHTSTTYFTWTKNLKRWHWICDCNVCSAFFQYNHSLKATGIQAPPRGPLVNYTYFIISDTMNFTITCHGVCLLKRKYCMWSKNHLDLFMLDVQTKRNRAIYTSPDLCIHLFFETSNMDLNNLLSLQSNYYHGLEQ